MFSFRIGGIVTQAKRLSFHLFYRLLKNFEQCFCRFKASAALVPGTMPLVQIQVVNHKCLIIESGTGDNGSIGIDNVTVSISISETSLGVPFAITLIATAIDTAVITLRLVWYIRPYAFATGQCV